VQEEPHAYVELGLEAGGHLVVERSRRGKDDTAHLLGMETQVARHEHPAPGMADQVHFPSRAVALHQGVEVGQVGIESELVVIDPRRQSGPTLIVQHDEELVAERLERQQVSIVQSGPAVDGDHGGILGRAERLSMEHDPTDREMRQARVLFHGLRHLVVPHVGKQNEQAEDRGDLAGGDGQRSSKAGHGAPPGKQKGQARDDEEQASGEGEGLGQRSHDSRRCRGFAM
jgi:hypothetical protein